MMSLLLLRSDITSIRSISPLHLLPSLPFSPPAFHPSPSLSFPSTGCVNCYVISSIKASLTISFRLTIAHSFPPVVCPSRRMSLPSYVPPVVCLYTLYRFVFPQVSSKLCCQYNLLPSVSTLLREDDAQVTDDPAMSSVLIGQ